MVDRKTIEANLPALIEWAGGGDIELLAGNPVQSWKPVGDNHLMITGEQLRIKPHSECYRCGLPFEEEQQEAFCDPCKKIDETRVNWETVAELS